MIAFLDFEASSLSDRSVPVEVGWAVENGPEESHLILPEPGWTDWSAESQAVHGLSRADVAEHGRPAPWVARRLVDALQGHDVHSGCSGVGFGRG